MHDEGRNVVAAVAAIGGVMVVVAGWFVAQWQARRATRRSMRVQYLLESYRRLEQASNRPLRDDLSRELEQAIADIMLLGSPTQVALAEEFVQSFARDRTAEATPLLEDLRASLREELLLEPVAPTRVSLRIESGGPEMVTESRVWTEAREQVARGLQSEPVGDSSPGAESNPFVLEMSGLADAASPMAALEASVQELGRRLRSLVATVDATAPPDLNLAELAHRALTMGVIDEGLADSINGVGMMHTLAIVDPEHLTRARAMEVASYVAAILYVLDVKSRNQH